MAEPKLHQFSTFIGTLCVTRDTNVHNGPELFRTINGRAVPTKAIVAGLAKELDSNPRYLEKLAEEIRKDLGK
jgi:hypothetical protein